LMAFKVDPPPAGERVGQLSLTSGVAERYELSEDGRTYTFHLRQGAHWSNGQPVTAGDFRWSWQRVMTPATAADYATMMFHIAGARAYYRALADGGPASFADVGVRAVDDRTLEVRLEDPCAYFLELTAFPTFFPVYRPLLERHAESSSRPANFDGVATYKDAWTSPQEIVTNGPFVLKDHWYKRQIVLDKNPQYWDRANVALKQVRALAIEDSKASLHAYESGNCQYIDSLPLPAVRALTDGTAGKARDDFYRVTTFGTYFYRFNCQPTAGGQPNPLADPRIRRALAMAIDRKDIVAVAGGRQEPASTFIPPGLVMQDRQGRPVVYRGPAGQAFDVSAARKLLAEAGYPGGAGLGEIRLMYNAGFGHEAIAQRLQAMWKEQLGVQVTFLVKDGAAFGQALKKKELKEWHVGRGSWFGDYRDPTTFLDMFLTGDGNNDCGYSNPRFDDLMRQGSREPDAAARMALYRQAEQIAIDEDAAIVPLYHYVEYFMIAPGVQGAWPNQMSYLVLKQVKVE
jgi:oligopeptide transport system substrate-binding protein